MVQKEKRQDRDGVWVTARNDVQCLQVDDLIPILSPAVYGGFGWCGSQRFAWWHYFLMGV